MPILFCFCLPCLLFYASPWLLFCCFFLFIHFLLHFLLHPQLDSFIFLFFLILLPAISFVVFTLLILSFLFLKQLLNFIGFTSIFLTYIAITLDIFSNSIILKTLDSILLESLLPNLLQFLLFHPQVNCI